MKKTFLTSLFTLLIMMVVTIPVQAAEQKSFGDVTYKIVTLENGKQEVHITGLTNHKNRIVVPEKIEGLPVVELIDRALYTDRSDYASDGTYSEWDIPGYKDLFITEIELPKTLKRIGDGALASHLIEKISLPEGLEEIGHMAFANNNLTSIAIPKSVKKIGGNIVSGNRIKTYSLPPSFKKPESKKVGNFLYVKFTHNGKPEIRVTGHTFKKAQTKIIVPNQIDGLPVTEIDDYAFAYSSSLLGHEFDFSRPFIKEVVLPNTVRVIGDHALSGVYYDNNNRDFTLPRDLEVIGDYAFKGNYITNKGNSLKLPAKLKSIGKGAFHQNRLEAVTIPSTVTSIGKYAFEYNILKNVTIGDNVKNLEAGVFRGNQISNLKLPKQLNSIGAEAFAHNELRKLILPSTVKSIGDFAFMYNRLEEATLPTSLHTIGDGTFANNKLTVLKVPGEVKNLPFNVVIDNPLQAIVLQGSATKILSYTATSRNYRTDYYKVMEKVDQLYTDKNFTEIWSNWDTVITKPTTLYVTWKGQERVVYEGEAEAPVNDEKEKDDPKIEQPATDQPAQSSRSFSDTENYWAKDTIADFVAKGIISGYPDGTFRPNDPMQRKHVASILEKVYELKSKSAPVDFKDVTANHPNYAAISKLQQAGVIHGADGLFRPNDTLTRGQMAKILVLASNFTPGGQKTFPDVPRTYWAYDYIAALADLNIVGGSNGQFNPNGAVTRGQFVGMLDKALKVMEK
ncbi:leucine-rich repeat protein [Solibacillus sp. FSL W8-0474]|uniref:leucine-rich repeat protein n=1 Tax=Solibacillus sp. FSL W8-0474 TaxID=2975336 RepID=UPI0030F6B13A